MQTAPSPEPLLLDRPSGLRLHDCRGTIRATPYAEVAYALPTARHLYESEMSAGAHPHFLRKLAVSRPWVYRKSTTGLSWPFANTCRCLLNSKARNKGFSGPSLYQFLPYPSGSAGKLIWPIR